MEPYVPLKTSADVTRMRPPCRLLSAILREVGGLIRPELDIAQVDQLCAHRLNKAHAEVSHRRLGFPGAASISVNNVAAHGIPSHRVLEDGDIVTVDISTRIDGWSADAAWTYVVGQVGPEALRLLRAAWQTTNAGVAACRAGRRLGDVAAVIEHTAARHGCSVVKTFTGHGIGRELHEEPVVANTGSPAMGRPVVPGMVLTIEPVLSLGNGEVRLLEDGWTYVSADGEFTAQFEHTVSVFSQHTEVLTYDGSLDTELPPY
ncbi:MAG: type I methionyl aminopeptidase [Spirochaetota bacterium]